MMNKFAFLNDTGREVSIHPGTKEHNVSCNMDVIKPHEVREFILPENTYAMVKLWDYQKYGLQLIVLPKSYEEPKKKSYEDYSLDEIIEEIKNSPQTKHDDIFFQWLDDIR